MCVPKITDHDVASASFPPDEIADVTVPNVVTEPFQWPPTTPVQAMGITGGDFEQDLYDAQATYETAMVAYAYARQMVADGISTATPMNHSNDGA